MAASKKVAPARPKTQAQRAPHDPRRPDGTTEALSKAFAVWWLLDELSHGELAEGARTNTSPQARDGETRDRLLQIASNALYDAVNEAEDAYRKSRGGTPQVAA